MKRTKLLCLFLAVLMLLSLTACGKGGKEEPEDPNLLTVGEFELRYKGASIMTDYEGNDALVLTLDFTNNSKETTDYFWAIYETAMHNDTELDMAIVYLNEETLESVDDSQYQNVDPGATVEIQTAFELDDTTGEVEVIFEEMTGSKNDSITIDLSTVSRESAGSGASNLTGGNKGDGSGGAAVSGGGQPREWWNGDWYGWWVMTGCWGYYEDMEGDWWDICGTIDIGEDGMGTVTLWDEDYTKSEPMVSASVSLDEAGTSEFGTMMSEGGWFTDIALEHADWIVDPGLVDYPDMIHISGYYESGDDAYSYDIYLRPWGTYWDDVIEEDLPYYYYDWYLPLMESGESMPDYIG
ncbi:DUF5067 domain-containing protein [Pseudoflavonifractor sp. AF19-9AC]|uniref:DUF5067 domain-containing protein n=1 Tax=Pseudoflavonifractor sp. AF19-9AC TaxID=2292244 RepID=UPI000E4CF5D9|nr:DUF5067 domain-containing protein [Pseudoflavonifractor sp. AF19-9AC]RHR11038.1 DUF5067 domain-containing protein [Pseudoflavonifractor sp. AF19-9AC]